MSRMTARKRSLVGVALVTALAGIGASGIVIAAALAGPVTPTPTILSGPSAPTTATSASFTYADSKPALFRCSLDAALYLPCLSSGASYSHLSDGSHTFQVEALAAGSSLSQPASRTWSVDTSAPKVTISFPAGGASYGVAAWNAGCSPAGVCGSATDATGVSQVKVALLQRSTNKYWDGTGFTASSPLYRTASGTTAWRVSLPSLPSSVLTDGAYTASVLATDTLGNATPVGYPVVATFRIDTVAPAAPSITESPAPATFETSADLAATDAESGVSFRCSLDGKPSTTCMSEDDADYENLAPGNHCFQVTAVDAAGNASPATSYCWTIAGEKSFVVNGSVQDVFVLGVTKTVNLVISNPYSFDIKVTAVTVTVQAATTRAATRTRDATGPRTCSSRDRSAGPWWSPAMRRGRCRNSAFPRPGGRS